jgi:hypothetical protein
MKRKPQFHEESGLVRLLDARLKSEGLGDGKKYRKPALDPITIRCAAQAHADVNRSDPFAFARMRLHIAQGYELASDVLAEAASKQRARGHATNVFEEAA